ncbi:MAG: FecR protein [Candidatus Parcubacteria bacterium]
MASALAVLAGAQVLAAGPADMPQGDFTLYMGRMRRVADPSDIETALRVSFNAVTVDIKGDKVVTDKTVPTSYKIGEQDFNGSVTMKFDGTYDKDSGALSGTAEIDTADQSTAPSGATGSSSASWRGSFTGQVVNGRASLKYALRGSSTYTFRERNGSTDSGGHSGGGTYGVVYDISTSPVPAAAVEPAPERKDSDITFGSFRGQVEIHYPDEPPGQWRVVKRDTKISVNAHIRTLEESTAMLRFADMSVFVMQPETELVIETPPERQSKVGLIAGKIYANLKQIAKDGTMEIDMDQAICGIKGTTLVAENGGGVSSVKVIEGAVELRSKKTGEMKTVSSGRSGSVGADGAVQTGAFDAVAEVDAWAEPEKADWSAVDALPEPAAAGSPTASGMATAQGRGAGNTWKLPAMAVIVLVLVGAAIYFMRSNRSRA